MTWNSTGERAHTICVTVGETVKHMALSPLPHLGVFKFRSNCTRLSRPQIFFSNCTWQAAPLRLASLASHLQRFLLKMQPHPLALALSTIFLTPAPATALQWCAGDSGFGAYACIDVYHTNPKSMQYRIVQLADTRCDSHGVFVKVYAKDPSGQDYLVHKFENGDGRSTSAPVLVRGPKTVEDVGSGLGRR